MGDERGLTNVMNLGANVVFPDWLTRRASTHPDVPAVVHTDGTWTYRTLYQHACALAGSLRVLGVERGTRVALLMEHGLSFVLAAHALIQAGAIAVPINRRLTVAEMEWQIADSEARFVLHDTQLSALAGQVQGPGGSLQLLNVQAWQSGSAKQVRREFTPDEVQVLIYTSGTTGRPKGAMLTYGNIMWSAMASALQLGLDRHERWLIPMPLFHMGGWSVLMRSVIYGTTVIVQDKFDEHIVNEAILDGATIVSVVPTMLGRMLDALGALRYPSSLRCVLLGGSAAPKSLLMRCQEKGIPVAQSYGLTETASQAATLAPEDGLRKLGSSGKPLLPTQIRIVRKDGTEASPGEAGDIQVQGPTVISGYWRRKDATAESFIDGWFRTGDIGYFDDEEYLYVLDRRKDLIVSGGENIYPAEVESALTAHPDVLEAGVVGEDDPVWGQVPVAFVVCGQSTNLRDADLQTFCRTQLAGYKVPKRVLFVNNLPRNASGKLLRRNLSEWLSNFPPSN